jgi:hypothetical protein
MLQQAMAYAVTFHVDIVQVLDSGWFEWKLRNAALEAYSDLLPSTP